jgi:hypothetical protein
VDLLISPGRQRAATAYEQLCTPRPKPEVVEVDDRTLSWQKQKLRKFNASGPQFIIFKFMKSNIVCQQPVLFTSVAYRESVGINNGL